MWNHENYQNIVEGSFHYVFSGGFGKDLQYVDPVVLCYQYVVTEILLDPFYIEVKYKT